MNQLVPFETYINDDINLDKIYKSKQINKADI